tara:strand:- start:941 stop:2068 length:1128 start_codon:yes stop_codon:yes gene_type:complete
VAGEPSGDQLGGGLMAALQNQFGKRVTFLGIGGEQMTSEGLKSLFPMSDLSVMGFVEVLPKLSVLRRRLRDTAEEIRKINPDVLVTIDSPGFNFRLVELLQDLNFPKIHYVAPTVWAWRPSRAKKMSKFYDHLMVLLPFEPEYFNYDNMKCTFVGHPVTEELPDKLGINFRDKQNISKKTILGVFPGSRKAEVLRMLPVFEKTVKQLSVKFPELEIIITTIPHLSSLVRSMTSSWNSNVILVDSFSERKGAQKACDVALAASGTITTELAAAKVPVIVGYKVAPITAFIARRLLKVSYVSLLNIATGRRVLPEFLQQECNPRRLSDAITELLVDKTRREHQISEQLLALRDLNSGAESGYSKAAAIVKDAVLATK